MLRTSTSIASSGRKPASAWGGGRRTTLITCRAAPTPPAAPAPPALEQLPPNPYAPPPGPPEYMVPTAVYNPADHYAQNGAPREYQQMPPPPPPAGYYYPPYQPVQESAGSASAVPWFIWIGVGFMAHLVFTKVMEFKANPKTPQQMMMEMAMKQMASKEGAAGMPGMLAMKQMAGKGGMPGGMPPGFGGMPGMPPGGMPPGFGAPPGGAPGGNTTWDVSAGSRGEKFQARSTPPPPSPSSYSSNQPNMDVVEPTVKEPTGSSSRSNSTSSASFKDVPKEQPNPFAQAQAGANPFAQAGPNPFAQGEQATVFWGCLGGGNPLAQARANPFAQGEQATGGGGGDGGGAMSMMEQMLKNPEMQKMLYPYLPEGMRNPESIDFMMKNPEVKKQMEQMFANNPNMMSPQMAEMMKNTDFNQDKINAQFGELGLKPEDVVAKDKVNQQLGRFGLKPEDMIAKAAIMVIS
eukprot:gene945-33932_t